MKKFLGILGAIVVIAVVVIGVLKISVITPQRAIDIVKKQFDEKSIETVTNFENPEVEEIDFESCSNVHWLVDDSKLIGKSLYKVTFRTTQDGLLGPMVFYVDKSNGKIVGGDYRE